MRCDATEEHEVRRGRRASTAQRWWRLNARKLKFPSRPMTRNRHVNLVIWEWKIWNSFVWTYGSLLTSAVGNGNHDHEGVGVQDEGPKGGVKLWTPPMTVNFGRIAVGFLFFFFQKTQAEVLYSTRMEHQRRWECKVSLSKSKRSEVHVTYHTMIRSNNANWGSTYHMYCTQSGLIFIGNSYRLTSISVIRWYFYFRL